MKLQASSLAVTAALSLFASYHTIAAGVPAAGVPAAGVPAAPPPATLAGSLLQPSSSDIPQHCEQGIAAVRAQILALEQIPVLQAKAKTILGGWNQMEILLQNLDGPMELLAETHPDEAVRKAAEACSLKLGALPNEYLQSTALYTLVKAVNAKDAVDAAARQSILDDFEQRGVSLPPEKRERAKAIFEQLDKLSQDFSRNTRQNTQKLAFDDAQLQGVPADALKGRAKDEQGRWIFGMDYPENDAIMENAEQESTRQVYWMAFNQRGGAANLDLLNESTRLRRELAALMGVDNFADWSIKRKMAGDAKTVHQFLDKVQSRVEALELKELGELRLEKATFTGNPNAELKRWDVAFFQQRLKKSRYSVDQEAVRKQFPTQPTIDWLLKVSGTLYNVQFRENKNLKTWHPDVRGFDVFEPQTGAYMSSFYLDLFPRDGKYKHAAAFAARRGSTIVNGTGGRKPASVLVTNFSREGFNQDELETLFHEFGHIMHGVLSKTRYVFHSGTAVKRDFVEAPSQMFEEWSRRPESLALFAKVCPACQPIDPELTRRMNASRAFGQGIRYARQRVYAAWDMALYGPAPVDAMNAWIDIESKSPLGHVPGSMVPASFGHVIQGYSAGYYGYMWSEVLALDMLSRYGNNVMDTKVGARYRKMILERGGEQHPAQMVQAFLGRKPSSEAFFREITGQRLVK